MHSSTCFINPTIRIQHCAIKLKKITVVPRCLIKHHTITICEVTEVQLHAFSTSSLNVGKRSTSPSRPL